MKTRVFIASSAGGLAAILLAVTGGCASQSRACSTKAADCCAPAATACEEAPRTAQGPSCQAHSDGASSSHDIAPAAEGPRCALTPAELQDRRAGLIPGLRQRAAQVTPLENGYRMKFASHPGLLDELNRTIEQERACCAFLKFKIEIEPDGGSIALEVTGPPGTREMLDKL